MTTTDNYIPALRYRWLTRFYDPVVALTTRENRFKARLVELAGIEPQDNVLDIGCGTGTLAIRVKDTQGDARVTGLDGDPQILEIARRKASLANVDVTFEEGLSYELAYGDETFDYCLSSLFFHHLTLADKSRTFVEMNRVLKPGGQCVIADWGKPQNRLMRYLFYQVQLLDGFTTTNDNIEGKLPHLMASAGFNSVMTRDEINTMFGTMTIYSATKSE